MSTQKQLWLLAGGNGAGKSTFYRTQLQPLGMPFVNADNIAREVFPDNPEAHSYQAAAIAENMRNELLAEGRSFCFETVFSHPSKIDFMASAKALGYEVVLVFIYLDSPALHKARIHQRTTEGGHAVPEDKVETRLPRTFENMKTAIQLADKAFLLDNSDNEQPFILQAKLINGALAGPEIPMPDWVLNLLRES
ncbi:MAG: AAA family ATPase [Oleiphilaceae bacterium]|nr:AAA family ATPase [Oleiphilaceae bacterium]